MRLALYVCLKTICDGVGGQDESNGTPLDPPLFWLDNIFKLLFILGSCLTHHIYDEVLVCTNKLSGAVWVLHD